MRRDRGREKTRGKSGQRETNESEGKVMGRDRETERERVTVRAKHKYSNMEKEKNSREKWRKCISVTGSLRGQVQVRPIDKLDEARTNSDDQMMLVQHYSGDRVMSYRGFDRIS